MPDIDELNAKIPENEWELGLNAKPRPPWQLNWVVYLLNPETADTYTFLNSTAGARIAVERLEDKFHWMRRMRGPGVVPIVRLDSRPMKTNFGQKMRPEFTILEWRDIGTAEQKATPQIEQQKPAPDSTASNPSTPAAKTRPGKPVKPVELDEELDDSIPF